jgi:hypothetical protein
MQYSVPRDRSVHSVKPSDTGLYQIYSARFDQELKRAGLFLVDL